MTSPPADRTQPYSAESYAAQYGVTVEDAAEILEGCQTHQQAERGIFALYKMHPNTKTAALFRGEEVELTQEERKMFERGGVDMKEIGRRMGARQEVR